MTEQEHLERHRAEIARIYTDMDQMRANIEASRASVEHMRQQNEKLAKETRWYETVVVLGVIAATAAFVKVFL